MKTIWNKLKLWYKRGVCYHSFDYRKSGQENLTSFVIDENNTVYSRQKCDYCGVFSALEKSRLSDDWRILVSSRTYGKFSHRRDKFFLIWKILEHNSNKENVNIINNGAIHLTGITITGLGVVGSGEIMVPKNDRK